MQNINLFTRTWEQSHGIPAQYSHKHCKARSILKAGHQLEILIVHRPSNFL